MLIAKVVARPAVCLLCDVSHVGEDDGEGDGEGAGHSQKGEVTVSVDLHLKEGKHKKSGIIRPPQIFSFQPRTSR